MPVLQSRHPDVLRPQAELQPQFPQDVSSGVSGLADMNVQVFALTRRQVERHFVDLKIGWHAPQHAAGPGSVGERAQIVPGEGEAGRGWGMGEWS